MSRTAQTEAAFQRQVLALFRLHRWRAYHTRDSRGSEAGFPDLVLVRGRTILYAELKSAKGWVTSPQQAWLDALRDAGQRVHVWRPADWEAIVAAAEGR